MTVVQIPRKVSGAAWQTQGQAPHSFSAVVSCSVMRNRWTVWREQTGTDGKPDWGTHNNHRLRHAKAHWTAVTPPDDITSYRLHVICAPFPDWELLYDPTERWIIYLDTGKRTMAMDGQVGEVRLFGRRLHITWLSQTGMSDIDEL